MGNRIIGLDLARALAVFGMVVVNFKVVMVGDGGGLAWLSRLVGLLDGRAAATFVVLAGIGISLRSQKALASRDTSKLAQTRVELLKRAVFLFLAGLLYLPLWPGDILHFYGIYIAISSFLLPCSPRLLLILASMNVLSFPLLTLVLDYEQGWDWTTLTYNALWTPAGMMRNLFFNGFHPVIPWLSFLLLGMVLGRLNLGDEKVCRRLFAWGAGVALGSELASIFLGWTLPSGLGSENLAVLLGSKPMPPMPLYFGAGGGFACALIAAMVALGERHRGASWLSPFLATGQLALTLYVAHVVVGMGVLEILGRLEGQTLPFSLFCAGFFCLCAMLFSALWLRKFRHGPLEALLRARTTESRKSSSQ